jgi:hypothetical protein
MAVAHLSVFLAHWLRAGGGQRTVSTMFKPELDDPLVCQAFSGVDAQDVEDGVRRHSISILHGRRQCCVLDLAKTVKTVAGR